MAPLPLDPYFAKWGFIVPQCLSEVRKRLDTVDTFKSEIEAAGFVDIHEEVYKLPIGEWAEKLHCEASGKIRQASISKCKSLATQRNGVQMGFKSSLPRAERT